MFFVSICMFYNRQNTSCVYIMFLKKPEIREHLGVLLFVRKKKHVLKVDLRSCLMQR